MEADQYLVPEQGKYDLDGPKNLYDNKMLIDWYLKIVQEHPLVTYIEDGIRAGDNVGWQQLCAALKAKNVQAGVKNWFKSDIGVTKEHTQIVVLEKDEEEQEDTEAVAQVDLNVSKFIPNCVHLSKPQCFSTQAPQNALATI